MKTRYLITILFATCLMIVPNTVAMLGEPVLKWDRAGCTHWCMTGWYASPAVADLDGNGTMEVVWASYKVWVLDAATGDEYWSVYTGHDVAYTGDDYVGRTWPSPVVADIDGNGTLDIVTAHSGGWVCAYDFTGRFLPGWPVQATPESELRTLAVYDLDNDGTFEILVASTSFGNDEEWYVYEHNGQIRSGWPQHDGDCCAAGCFNQNIAIADIDQDNYGEIIGPNDTHYICAFQDNGACIPAHPMYENRYWGQVGVWVDLEAELRGWGHCGTEHRPNFCHSAPVVADLNSDGNLEIIVIGNVHNCGTSPYTDLYEVPIILNRDRSRFTSSGFDWSIWPSPPSPGAWAPLSQDYSIIESCQPNPTVVDVDHDGIMEIFYPAYDGKVHGFKLDKTEFGHWPFSVCQAGEGIIRFASEVLAADLDGDGTVEIIFGSWPEKSSGLPGKLYILTSEGLPLFAVDIPHEPGRWNGILGAHTLADIDGDNELELVAGTSATGVIAYDLPGAVNSEIYWGTSRGSNTRHGAIETELTDLSVYITINQTIYSPGDTIRVGLGLENPRNNLNCDLYLCILLYDIPLFISPDPIWPTFDTYPYRFLLRPLPANFVLDPIEIITLPLMVDTLPSLTFDWYAVLTSGDSLNLFALDMETCGF
ncbi:VCBS repeat-containing protein [bacterium]|nr:VCBS repeat-containing protein [bacterium]